MSGADLVHTLGRPYSVVSKSDGAQMRIWVNVNVFGSAEHLSVARRGVINFFLPDDMLAQLFDALSRAHIKH